MPTAAKKAKSKVTPIDVAKPKKSAPVPPVPIDQVDESVRNELEDLLVQRAKYKVMEDELKAVLKDNKKTGEVGLNTIIQQMQELAGVKSVLVPHDGRILRTTVVNSSSKMLSAKKLLAAGIPADVIDSCYDVKPYTTLQTVFVGQEEEEE